MLKIIKLKIEKFEIIIFFIFFKKYKSKRGANTFSLMIQNSYIKFNF